MLGKVLNRIKDIFRLSIISTLYYNYLSPHVKRINGGKMKIFRHTRLYFEKGAKLIVENGTLALGDGKPYGAKNASLIRIQKDSVMHAYGGNTIEYGADILLKPNASLILKRGSYLNCHSLIRCHAMISIGEGTIAATKLEIRDSDGHVLNGVLSNAPVTIGDRVWIGSQVTILKGVTVGNGCMIGACALVTRDIPERCLAYGIPASVKKENIEWEY